MSFKRWGLLLTKNTMKHTIHSRNVQLLFAFWASLWLLGCAQQIPPTGGKKDIIAPKLIRTIPQNEQTNYKGRTVELFFDEYIEVQNLQQKLLITPNVNQEDYEFKAKPTSFLIKFRKSLDSNKTYSLNFGDAIKDFAEKNPAQNLRFVFSTGVAIDSASVGGEVLDAETNNPVFDALVGLYKCSDTLNPEKMKPYYFARTDSAGTYQINNVQADRYQVIAITDANRTLTYQPKLEKIGFIKDSINVKASDRLTNVNFRMFKADYSPPKFKGTLPRVKDYSLLFDKGIREFKVDYLNKGDSLVGFQPGPTEIKFYNVLNKTDTIPIKITVRDSLGLELVHSQKIKFRESKVSAKGKEGDKEALTVQIKPQTGEELTKDFEATFSFNKPIVKYDLSSIKLTSDSATTEKLNASTFAWTNNNTRLVLNTKISARSKVRLILPKNTFFSVQNDTLKADTLNYKMANEDDYAIVKGSVKNAKTNVIVQLLDEKYTVIKSIAGKKEYEFTFVKPGTYFVRTIVDTNNNSKWDAGNYKQKLQPEKIVYYSDAFKVRKNFIIDGIDFEL